MLRLRKCKKSKVYCTTLYLTVLSLTIIMSTIINIWRASTTRKIQFHQPSLHYAPFIRDSDILNTSEIKGKMEGKQRNAVKENNDIFSEQAQNRVSKAHDDNKHEDLFIGKSSSHSRHRTNLAKLSFQSEFSRSSINHFLLSADVDNRRNGSSSRQGRMSDGQTNEDDDKDDNAYEKSNTHGRVDDRDTPLPEDAIKNRSKLVINEDWVTALRTRTTRMGIRRKRNLHWTIAMSGQYSSHLFTPPVGEIPRQRLPHAIIIGVGHCGTRALINFLTMHPHIVTSNSEIHFYDKDVNFAKGYNWYRAQMPLSYSNQITMEKTPCYIWSGRALNEIYKMNKRIKLIVIMKDPVARLVSMKLKYNLELIKAEIPLTSDGVLHSIYDSNVLVHGAYVTFLKPWFSAYPISQIHVLEGSDFVKNPVKEIHKLESFLQVPHLITEKNFYFNASKGFYCMRPLHTSKISCLNDNKGRQHAKLDPDLERKLYDYYRDYNEKLFQLLGQRYSWEPGNLSNSVLNRNSFDGRRKHTVKASDKNIN